MTVAKVFTPGLSLISHKIGSEVPILCQLPLGEAFVALPRHSNRQKINDNLPPPHAKNPQPVGCGFPVYLGIAPSASASLNSKL